MSRTLPRSYRVINIVIMMLAIVGLSFLLTVAIVFHFPAYPTVALFVALVSVLAGAALDLLS